MVGGILSSGLEGIARSREGLNQSAKTIASGGQADAATNSGIAPIISGTNNSNTDQMLDAVVDLNVYEVQFKASAKVISTANETVGTLLDEIV